MQANTRNFFLLAAAAAVGITISILLLMTVRHTPRPAETVKPNVADAAAIDPSREITQRLRQSEFNIDGLKVTVVDGIAIIRGKVASGEQVEAVAAAVKGLGYARVANMVQPRPVADDAAIVREAERQLSTSPALEGCTFGVASKEGVVTVRGSIRADSQRNTVERMMKRLAGVSGVQLELNRS